MKLRRLTLLALACALVALFYHVQKSDQVDAAKRQRLAAIPTRVPLELCRGGDATYLTIAEWNLVFGPEEYADYLRTRPPSRFPYLGQIQQFWDAYRTVFAKVEKDYPYNGEYHLMDTVIGVSATAEYLVKCAYERSLGRIAEASCGSASTPEDELAAQVAQNYITFVKVDPWYLFDFATPLKQVWTETGWTGPHLLRKWERKYFLTSEYAIKVAYAWLIKKGSEGAFDKEEMVTAAVVDGLPEAAHLAFPAIKELQRFEDGSRLVTLPRYQAFTDHALGLAEYGVSFQEIAGNSGKILVSVLAPDSYQPAPERLLLAQQLLTRPGERRLVLEIPVDQLAVALKQIKAEGLTLEHIYDY